jgi:hypothetical protein
MARPRGRCQRPDVLRMKRPFHTCSELVLVCIMKKVEWSCKGDVMSPIGEVVALKHPSYQDSPLRRPSTLMLIDVLKCPCSPSLPIFHVPRHVPRKWKVGTLLIVYLGTCFTMTCCRAFPKQNTHVDRSLGSPRYPFLERVLVCTTFLESSSSCLPRVFQLPFLSCLPPFKDASRWCISGRATWRSSTSTNMPASTSP